MSVRVTEFLSGMRRLAHISKTEVTQPQLAAIAGMLDPLSSGYVTYGSFVERILTAKEENALMSDLEKLVTNSFGHSWA